METRIVARLTAPSDAIRQHALRQVGSLARYYDGITDARVTLSDEAQAGKRAEVALNVYRQTLAARHTGPSHEAAVDACVRQLRRQVLRYKDKLRHKGDRGDTPKA